MIPNSQDGIVHLADGSTLQIANVPPFQPEAPLRYIATLKADRYNHADAGSICLIEWRDAQWRLAGPAPIFNTDPYHPDLPHHLMQYVAAARRAVASTPQCHSVACFLVCYRSGTDDELVGQAIWKRQSEADPNRPAGIVEERTLDQVPNVRFVEREVVQFARWLDIKPYEDGTGFYGDLDITITPNAFTLAYSTPDGDYLRLESALRDGHWQHRTKIELACGANTDDPVAQLRAHRSPYDTLREVLMQTHFGQIEDFDIRGLKVVGEYPDDGKNWAIQPGTLIRKA